VRLTVTDNAGATGTTSQNVTVSAPSGAPCTNCEAYSGSLSGTGDWQAQPNGNYYYSSGSGTHRGWLRGPTSGADFDLYLYKWNGFSWAWVARGITSNSSEDVVYSGTAGYYYWRIVSYSGSGSYDFWMQRP
jgi:serine protease